MIKIKLPCHLEESRTHCPQPEYKHRTEFSDPYDTLPSPEASSKARFSYLYQGGKWTHEDDGFCNDKL